MKGHTGGGSGGFQNRESSVTFMGGIGMCYPPCDGLNMKCFLQAHLFNPWFPAGGALLEGSGKFRRWV
jgi:hypothetical protein